MGFRSWLSDRIRSGHDGGGHDRLNSGWTPVNGTGEEINQMSREVVKNRARDMERNADDVGAVIDAMERNAIGTGIQLQAKTLLPNGKDNEALNDQIEELWRVWSKPGNCDVTGRMSLTEMQDMAVRRRLVDGGLLFIKCGAPAARIPFQLQMKEVDELDTSIAYHDTGGGKNKVVGGIELDGVGRIIAYHFKEYDLYGWTGRSRRVKAKHVIYLCYRTRPTEVREFSPLGKVLTRVRDLTEYIKAVSVKERILACLAVFIERVNGRGNYGRNSTPDDKTTGYKTKKLTPGMIENIGQGDKVHVVNPSGQASNARELVITLKRNISAALGLSYETTSRDMSQVNYSSARQGLLDDQKTFARWQHYLIEHFLEPVYEEFLTACVTAGLLKIPDYFSHRERYDRCLFIPNGMPWIDPLKEANGNKIALETGQTTLEDIYAAKGEDWREKVEQRAQEIQYMRELGLAGSSPQQKGGVAGEVTGGSETD